MFDDLKNRRNLAGGGLLGRPIDHGQVDLCIYRAGVNESLHAALTIEQFDRLKDVIGRLKREQLTADAVEQQRAEERTVESPYSAAPANRVDPDRDLWEAQNRRTTALHRAVDVGMHEAASQDGLTILERAARFDAFLLDGSRRAG